MTCPFVLTHFIFLWLCATTTAQRKAALGFASLMVLMVGIELKYFGDQLKPTNDIVRKYIFCDYSFATLPTLLFLLH